MNAAIVLCGGASRRLGRDKCQARFGRETMIGHVLRAIQSCVSDIFVVGRALQHPDEVIPAEFRETTKFVTDAFPGGGPLEGIRAGLESLPGSIHRVLVCGCDTPLITPKLIECLFQMADGYEAAVPWIDGKWCPLPAVYQRNEALSLIDEMHATGERSLWRLVERLQARRVMREELEHVDPGLEGLINVNDAETLETVAMIWAHRHPLSD